jgi:hypothetical protein
MGDEMDQSWFYCLKCGQLIDVNRASRLFRTGFFHIEYPLGCCSSCESKDDKTVSFKTAIEEAHGWMPQ